MNSKMVPILSRLSNRVKSRLIRLIQSKTQNSNVTYSGCYLNFEEVLHEFDIQDHYSTLEQFNSAKEQARELLLNSDTRSFPNLGWASQRLNFLPNFISSLDRNRLKILDVGGGFGETYLTLQRRVSTDVQYDIIELEKTVLAGKDIFKGHQNLNFYTSETYSPSEYDLVYFGSSLQYFKEWKAMIELALAAHPKHVLISDTTVGEIPTFVCAQINDPRIVIPRWVFNIKDLDNLFSDSGYRRVLRTSNYYPFHNFYNYEGEYRNIEHTNLCYSREIY
jgi:putative methyltransferase (TIGR04325 family)